MAAVSRRQRQMKRRGFATGLVAALVVLGAAWAGGLVWFAGIIPDSVADHATRTDAIVVLTGGQGRLDSGLQLLAEDRAERLFVSGVYRGIDVKTLLGMFRRTPDGIENRVGIGDAVNTAGNAAETGEWVRRHGLTSIRLVTASYHMPRSLLEFHHALPEVTIIPHPVFSENVKQKEWWAWPGTATLIAREYSKYLLVRLKYVGDWLNDRPGAAG